ncbi:MAG: MOSC domain-containing protein [Anaerolineae bacterium]
MTARIFQLNASNGGVPKMPMRRAEVNLRGITLDEQADKQHHGSPEQALCLFSLERILELQAEGHPIYPGSTGENVTIAGLDWTAVVPGVRLRLGDEALVEITDYATPCHKIRRSFVDEDYGRLSETRHPGWARAYGRVLQIGRLHIGDAVSLIE